MPHNIYILQSQKDLGYYIGETSDVEARLKFHNNGLQRSTRHRTPFQIIVIEVYPDRSTALKRKKKLKAGKEE